MSFRITGQPPAPFRPFYGMSDAEPGETVLLPNYMHRPEQTSCRSSYAIFVREGAEAQYDEINIIPAPLGVHFIALQAFDIGHDMIEAEIAEGTQLKSLIRQFFDRPETAYLHARYATHGRYAVRIDRVQEEQP